MPKQINAGPLTAALQRAFGFKGKYTPMLDEVVVPVYVVQDPAPAELNRICAGTTSQTASGPTFGASIQLVNPGRSGIILILTTAVVQDDTGKQGIRIGLTDPDERLADFASTGAFRDTRNIGVPISELLRENDRANIGRSIAFLQIDGTLAQTAAWIANSNDPRQPLVVLKEGDGIVFQQQDVPGTSVLRANFQWLEVPITQQPFSGIP